MSHRPPHQGAYYRIQRKQRLVGKEGKREKKIDVGGVEGAESLACDDRIEPGKRAHQIEPQLEP